MEETTLGRYKILREVGKGGMGIIYKAMNPQTQKSVAIKVLPPMMVDKVTVERFHREVQAMMKLKHSNLIDVYDFGMERGKHFLVMEFVEGENLKTVIKNKGALPVSESVGVAVQVADALLHMHKQGMIHRDIKPANIMITPEGKVKVMDYGLVKILGVTNITIDGTSLGTAEYMSPEQITGEGVDSRSDIYSFGITLYEMFSGRLPFTGETLQALLLKHQTETPVPLRQLRPEIPLELELLVGKAMAKNIAHRYQSVDTLLEDLKKLERTSSEKTSARGVSTKTSVPKSSGPSKTQKLVSAAGRMSSTTDQRPVHQFSWWMPILLVAIALTTGFFYKEKIVSSFKKINWKKIPAIHLPNNLLNETESSLKVMEEADTHFNQAQKYSQSGAVDQAVAEYRKAIELRGDYFLYYKELALLYEQKNQYKKAIQVWTDLLQYGKDPKEAMIAQQHIEQINQKLH